MQRARRECAAETQEQLDYALRLVAWSWIARDAGVQLKLIDVLVDAGAAFGFTPNDALVNGNFAAAEHLVARGARLTLATALCLERWGDAERLVADAPRRELQFALTLAALKGKTEAVRRLLAFGGVDVNATSPDLYSHATPVHHAVSAGSLPTVELLVAAGARLDARDAVYDGTPLDWAKHAGRKPPYAEIAAWLSSRA
jgi:peptide-methionine (S)-S-oxide reductase